MEEPKAASEEVPETDENGEAGTGEAEAVADNVEESEGEKSDLDAAEAAGEAKTASPLASKDDGKLHVLYLNHSGQISGAEQSLRSLLWQLRRSGIEFDPVVALPGSGPFADVLRDENWNVTFAPLRRLQRPNGLVSGLTSLAHILSTAPFITRLAQQTRAQIIHSNSTTAHLVGGLAAGRAGVPAIWHARDLVSLERIAPQLAQRATKVIAISNCVAERLKQDGVPEDKLVTILNGLDADEWYPRERSQLRESLGITEDSFIFGCIGQLVPWKNHAAFIEAANLIAQDDSCGQARFVVMGGDLWDEHAAYVKELRALVKKYNLQERFNFIPHRNDAVDALMGMDSLVLCSHEEPFGRVLIEAMALRKVAIAYAENGPLEIITNEHDGLLVQPDEENGLANAMRRALCEKELRDHIRNNARETVLEKFHIADSAQKVLDVYREVLS